MRKPVAIFLFLGVLITAGVSTWAYYSPQNPQVTPQRNSPSPTKTSKPETGWGKTVPVNRPKKTHPLEVKCDSDNFQLEFENIVINVTNPQKGEFQADFQDKKIKTKLTKNGAFSITGPSGTLASGRLRRRTLSLKSAGKTYMWARFYKRNIQLRDETGNLWVMKSNKNLWKIYHQGIELGKVKFYRDTHKLKIKNRISRVIANVKKVDRLMPGPAVMLIEDFPLDKQVAVMLTMLTIQQHFA